MPTGILNVESYLFVDQFPQLVRPDYGLFSLRYYERMRENGVICKYLVANFFYVGQGPCCQKRLAHIVYLGLWCLHAEMRGFTRNV